MYNICVRFIERMINKFILWLAKFSFAKVIIIKILKNEDAILDKFYCALQSPFYTDQDIIEMYQLIETICDDYHEGGATLFLRKFRPKVLDHYLSESIVSLNKGRR